MSRSTATSRLDASARTVASARSSCAVYRMPVEILDLGVTNYWDFRTGASGKNASTVYDMIGNLPVYYSGVTALSSVYSAGNYYADLEATSNDYFVSRQTNISFSPVALTVFAWARFESTSSAKELVTYWDNTTSERCFTLTIPATGTLRLMLSNNGTNQTQYETATTYSDTSAFHFFAATYDTTNRAIGYYDGAQVAMSLTSGTDPAALHTAKARVLIGSRNFSVPTNFFDGRIGICGMAAGVALSASQISSLYNITRRLGAYS